MDTPSIQPNRFIKFLYIPIAIATIISFVLFSGNELYGYDVYWHLKIGHDFLFSGLNPWIDRYSFSHYGQEISTLPIGFEVTLAFFVEMLGLEKGLYATRVLFYSLCYASIIIFFKKKKVSPALFTLASLTFLLCIITRPLVRPEISSLFLIVLTIALMIRTSEHFTNKNLFLCCLILIAWSNHHGGIIGYVILSGVFVQRALDIFQTKNYATIPKDFIWGLALLASGFLNFNFEHPVINTLMMPEVFKNYTLEYRSISTELAKYDLTTTMFFYVCYAAFLSIIAFFIALRRVGAAFVVLVLIISSAQHLRLFSTALFITIILLCIIKTDDFKKIYLRPHFKSGIYILAALTLFSVFPYAKQTLKANEAYIARFSQGVTNYLISNNSKSEQINIYNAFGHGGFYMSFLPENFKIYIDGRTHILYGPEFFSNYIQMNLDFSAEKLSKLTTEFDVKYISFPPDWKPLWVAYNAGYKYIAYIDTEIVLYSKTEDNLTQAGRDLLFPQCIKSHNFHYLDNMANHPLIDQTSQLYFLKHLSQPVNLNKDNLKENQILRELVIKLMPRLTDLQKRYLAHFFKEKKFLEPSINIFKNIDKKTSEDMFNLIQAYANSGNYEAAEQVLIYLTSDHWAYLVNVDRLGKDEMQIIFNLAHLLYQQAPSEKLSAFIEQLKQDNETGPMVVGTEYTLEDIDKYCLLFEN